jgi:hypothetical protein
VHSQETDVIIQTFDRICAPLTYSATYYKEDAGLRGASADDRLMAHPHLKRVAMLPCGKTMSQRNIRQWDQKTHSGYYWPDNMSKLVFGPVEGKNEMTKHFSPSRADLGQRTNMDHVKYNMEACPHAAILRLTSQYPGNNSKQLQACLNSLTSVDITLAK